MSPQAGDPVEHRTADGALVPVDDALASSKGNWVLATVRQGGEALGFGPRAKMVLATGTILTCGLTSRGASQLGSAWLPYAY